MKKIPHSFIMLHSLQMEVLACFFFFLPLAFSQNGLQSAFGAPKKFSGQMLPTNLEVGKHFLWTYEQMSRMHGVTLSHHEVAQEVIMRNFY